LVQEGLEIRKQEILEAPMELTQFFHLYQLMAGEAVDQATVVLVSVNQEALVAELDITEDLLVEQAIRLQLLQVRAIMAAAAGQQAHPMAVVVAVVRALLEHLVTVEEAAMARFLL
jgi:hypothetical protein